MSYQVSHLNEVSEVVESSLDEAHLKGGTDKAAESAAAAPKLPEVCSADMHLDIRASFLLLWQYHQQSHTRLFVTVLTMPL